MKIIKSTGSRGILLRRNAATLADSLAQGATSMTLTEVAFSDGDVVTIGEEDILITAAGLACTGLARGEISTVDSDHAAGQNVILAGGSEILNHSFDGSTRLGAIRCGADCEASFAVEIDGAIEYTAFSTPYALEVFFPCVPWVPVNGSTLRILAWNWRDEATFHALIQQ